MTVKNFQLRDMLTVVTELRADSAPEREQSIQTLEAFITWLLGDSDPLPGTLVDAVAKRLR